MRYAAAVLLLTACGVNRDVHQKALDESRVRGEELQVARGELEQVHAKLDETRKQLEAAQKDVAALRKKARAADVLRLVNLAAMHIHEAQVFALSKTPDRAAGSLAVASQLLGKLREEPSLEETPDVEKFARNDLVLVLELIGQAKAAFGSGPKGVATAQPLVDNALAKVEAALASQPAALETSP